MIELLKEINKILEMLDFTSALMDDFNLWNGGEENSSLPFGEDFVSNIFSGSAFLNLLNEEGMKAISDIYESLSISKENQDIFSETPVFLNFIDSNFFDSIFPARAINQEPETTIKLNSNFSDHEFSSITMLNKMFPELDFIENAFKDEILADGFFQKDFFENLPDNRGFENVRKNNINFLSFDKTENEETFDIDAIGEAFAEYIEQASINRSVADAY